MKKETEEVDFFRVGMKTTKLLGESEVGDPEDGVRLLTRVRLGMPVASLLLDGGEERLFRMLHHRDATLYPPHHVALEESVHFLLPRPAITGRRRGRGSRLSEGIVSRTETRDGDDAKDVAYSGPRESERQVNQIALRDDECVVLDVDFRIVLVL